MINHCQFNIIVFQLPDIKEQIFSLLVPFKIIYLLILFTYLWLHWVFVAAGLLCRLSLVAANRDYSSLRCMSFLSWRLLFLSSSGTRVHWLQQLWVTGLIIPWHVESSCTGIEPMSLALGRQILNHWTAREAPF